MSIRPSRASVIVQWSIQMRLNPLRIPIPSSLEFRMLRFHTMMLLELSISRPPPIRLALVPPPIMLLCDRTWMSIPELHNVPVTGITSRALESAYAFSSPAVVAVTHLAPAPPGRANPASANPTCAKLGRGKPAGLTVCLATVLVTAPWGLLTTTKSSPASARLTAGNSNVARTCPATTSPGTRNHGYSRGPGPSASADKLTAQPHPRGRKIPNPRAAGRSRVGPPRPDRKWPPSP